MDRCPICCSHDAKCTNYPVNDKVCSFSSHSTGYKCCYYNFDCVINDTILNVETLEVEKRYNLIVSFLLSHPSVEIDGKPHVYEFFYDDKRVGQSLDFNYRINIADIINSYPIESDDIVDRVLANLLYKHPDTEISIHPNDLYLRVLFLKSSSSQSDIKNIFNLLVGFKYMKYELGENYNITAEGLKRFKNIKDSINKNPPAFIAIKFGYKTKKIQQAIMDAISQSGYSPRIMTKILFNEQIVNKIKEEIEKSKFVVVDISYKNMGAYYESGYAEGLGKQVIMCCKGRVFKRRAHFDIAQKSSILWKDPSDLTSSLKERILETIK